jgi:hypothetical protein
VAWNALGVIMTKVNRNLQRQARLLASSSNFSYQQALHLIVGNQGNPLSNVFLQEESWLQQAVIGYYRKRGFKDSTLAHFQIKAHSWKADLDPSARRQVRPNIRDGEVNMPVVDEQGKFYSNAWQHLLHEMFRCNICNAYSSDRQLFKQAHPLPGQALVNAITNNDSALLARLVTAYKENGYPDLVCPACQQLTSIEGTWITDVYVGQEIESNGDHEYSRGSLAFAARPLYNYYHALHSKTGQSCQQLLLTPGITETWSAWQAGQTLTCSYIADEMSYAPGDEIHIYANKMKRVAELSKITGKPIVVVPEFYYHKKREQRLHFILDFLRQADSEADIRLLLPSPLLKTTAPLTKHDVDNMAADYLTDLQQQEGSRAVAEYIAHGQVPATAENIKRVLQ